VKILSILTFYYPHWTGLTTYARRIAEGLAARGHEVTVLTTRHSPELARDELLNGVRVVRLRPVARFSRGMIAPAFPYAAARLIAQHDAVQIHTPLPEALLVALLCRALGRPLVMTHHGDVVMPAGWSNQALQHIAFVILLAAGKLADAVTSYSRDYTEHSPLLRRLRDKVACIYPPVEIPEPDRAAALRWRAGLGLQDKLLIGFAGRWVEEKGFDYLLQALPLIRQVYPEAHLIYAGERQVVYENFYARCLPLIEKEREHLTFLGLLRDPQQMANFYGMCDLFALPSRSDMMALVQVEAMLCGTPVVATDIPGARVVVRETGFGRLARPHDPQSLAEAVIETLRHREWYRPTRQAVRRIFCTEKTLNAYEALLERLVQRPARAVSSGCSESATNKRVAAAPMAALPRRADPPVSRYPHSAIAPSALSAEEQCRLERILRNEADMAFRRRARILLDYLELRDGERVLDCGCGMGFYLMAMSRLRRLDLVGLDLNAGRLRWAQREGVPAALVCGDICRLPFADASFDKVLLSEVLEHLADDRHVLRELYRILKPGGILAISVPHAHYPFWWDPINRVWTALGGEPFRSAQPAGIWSGHVRLYRPHELRTRVEEAGFAVERLEEATHYSFPFIHFLVYGIGKPLLEHNLLPAPLRTSADRFRGEQNSGSLLNPINLGLALFRAIDRLNDRPDVATKSTFVNILVKARKPCQAAV
jgi:glycosyltransferase involved in cell wall biosynthesis/SAM-dependent methyltransferase